VEKQEFTPHRRRLLLPLVLAPWLGLNSSAGAAGARPWRRIGGLGQQDLIVIRHHSSSVSHPWKVFFRDDIEGPTTAVLPTEKFWQPISTALAATAYREEPPYNPAVLPRSDHGVHWALSVFSKGSLVTKLRLEADPGYRPFPKLVYGYVGDREVFFRDRRLVDTLEAALPELGLYENNAREVNADLILIYYSPTPASNPWRSGANNIMVIGKIIAIKPRSKAWDVLSKGLYRLIETKPPEPSPPISGVNWAIFVYRAGSLLRQISLRDETLPRAFTDDFPGYSGDTAVQFRGRDLVEALAAVSPMLGFSS
jgi:hypothetical protein